MLQRLPGAMFMIKNTDSRYIYMSRPLRETIHLPPGFEVVGKTDFDLFPKLIAETFRQNDLQVFNRDRPLINEIHATGFFEHPTQWCYSTKFPLHDRQGRVIGLITINEAYDKVMGRDAEMNRLLPAIEHVNRHFAESIAVADLARLCGYSETQFMRLFKKHLKMTAYSFVEQVRMFHALDSIRHSNRTIAEIAVESGFYDHSAFVKRFKKFVGSTPLRYRKQQQEQQQPTGRGVPSPTRVLPKLA